MSACPFPGCFVTSHVTSCDQEFCYALPHDRDDPSPVYVGEHASEHRWISPQRIKVAVSPYSIHGDAALVPSYELFESLVERVQQLERRLANLEPRTAGLVLSDQNCQQHHIMSESDVVTVYDDLYEDTQIS